MGVDLEKKRKLLLYPGEYQRASGFWDLMMMFFIGTYSVTTTLNVHSRSRSFVSAIDLRGLAPSMRLFRRPNTNGMTK